MQIIFDFLPILIFFIFYKLYGIYIATISAIAISLLQVLFSWIKYKRIQKMNWITLLIILILGGMTLAFHNEIFIKWKPTILYWVFALVFLGSEYIGKRNITERMLEKQIQLPQKIWTRLNCSWIIFFISMGLANLYVVYRFSTDIWVNFKLFGVLGLTFLFAILQTIFIARYIQDDKKQVK